MKYVFWQNIISIHQSELLKSLSKYHEVHLIVESTTSNQRLNEGWILPDMGSTQISITPTSSQIQVILNENKKDSIHIFSGINTFPIVYESFKMAVRNRNNIFVWLESYNWIGIFGIFRYLKYTLLLNRYKQSIDAILATGNIGFVRYKKTGFSSEKIFQWGYFTENKYADYVIFSDGKEVKPSIIYVGKINTRKNILFLVSVAKRLSAFYSQFTIIGNGPLEKELETEISPENKIKYLGTVSYNNIHNNICSHDLLILPSLFDGWGAVVNEALSVGTRVLCSDHCGASVLLDGTERGGVFLIGKSQSLEQELLKWLKKGKVSSLQRNKIIHWVYEHISGEIAAHYLNEICAYTYRQGKRPEAPWLK